MQKKGLFSSHLVRPCENGKENGDCQGNKDRVRCYIGVIGDIIENQMRLLGKVVWVFEVQLRLNFLGHESFITWWHKAFCKLRSLAENWGTYK